MNCKDLGIEPCRLCWCNWGPCLIKDIDDKLTRYPEQRKQLIMISLVEGVYYSDDNNDREDPKEVLRCYSALIKAKYKEFEHLLVLI